MQEPAITIRCITANMEGGRLAAGALVIKPFVPLEQASTKSDRQTDHQPDQSLSLWHEGEGRKAVAFLIIVMGT